MCVGFSVMSAGRNCGTTSAKLEGSAKDCKVREVFTWTEKRTFILPLAPNIQVSIC